MNRLFFVYLKDTSKEDLEALLSSIRKAFADSSVYKINGSNNFIVKVPEKITIADVMNESGLSEESKKVGIIMEIDSRINGWYSQALWDFVSTK